MSGRITILLCTRNGAAYLPEQLASYVAQEGVAWDLWVSDDASTDGTREILARFRDAHGGGRRIELVEGPGQGGAANFLTLIARPDLPQGAVALSDQDDVWLPHKLARAVAGLAAAGPVAIYGAQSLHTDQGLRVTGRSRPPHRRPGFAHALMQNAVSGHSLALSAGARRLAARAGVQAVPYHDWWLYQLVAGAGGEVVIDAEAVLYYRQHAGNAMGAHQGVGATVTRLGQVLGRGYGGWIAANLAALGRAEPLLVPEARATLAALRALPGWGPGRAAGFIRLGLHRQGRGATAGLWLAAACGRV
jgi:hypothetical protein